jgi:hypothetical protein
MKVGEAKNVLSRERISFIIKTVHRGSVKPIPVTDKQVVGISLLLMNFENALKFEPSVIEVDDSNNYIIVTVDRKWTEIPYVLSALTFILRLGITYDPGKDMFLYYTEPKNFISPHDAGYFKTATPILKDLLEGKVNKSQKYNPNDGIYDVHGLYGICSYANQYKSKNAVTV